MKRNIALKLVVMTLCFAMLLSACSAAVTTSTPTSTQTAGVTNTDVPPTSSEDTETIDPTVTPSKTQTAEPTPTPKDSDTPVDPNKEYEQFGRKIANTSLYSKQFEVWPENGNADYCPRAFFQCCFVVPTNVIDMQKDVELGRHNYSFKIYYRLKGGATFKGPYSAPIETCVDVGNNNVVYRLLVTECPEGDMISGWMVGAEYEMVVQILRNGLVVGYTNLFTTWTESFSNEYLIYKTFWSRHDRSKGYKLGDQIMTDLDINDPYGNLDLPTPPDDNLDRSDAVEIGSAGTGYGSIIREKSTGEILFSPEIDNLRDIVHDASAGEIIDGYWAMLTITVEDRNGKDFYTYEPLILPIYESKGEWFDTFLQGEEIDCGFCPVAGRTYDIYLEILSQDRTKVLYYGDYSDIDVAESLSGNKYYNAKPIPGEENIKYTITYAVKNGKGGKIEGSAEQHLKYGEKTTGVKAVADSGYVFMNWSDGSTDAERAPETVTRDKVIYAIFVKEGEEGIVADMYITTNTGSPIRNKTYVDGTVKIVSSNKEYALDAMKMQIRGRGNSSFNGGASQTSYDSKNSYRLKLETKEKLMGLGESGNRDWVLNSNKFDPSNLRNFGMWTLAEKMGTLPFNIECSWVNMYINGEYRGLYMVTELVEVAKGRVEVDDNVSSTDKGFLIELDFRGNQEDGVLGLDYFYIDGYPGDSDNPVEFVIKSNVDSTDDTAAIEAYMKKCHNAIMSGNRALINTFIDIPSMIDMFIIEEFSKDVDVGVASFFVQKNVGGKLYFTAPWDFDFGFGSYGPSVSHKGFFSEQSSRCLWFKTLIKQSWFREEVKARMTMLSPAVAQTIEAIKEKGQELYAASDRNCVFWNMYGNHFHGYISSNISTYIYSYQEQLDYLTDWMESRWSWMLNNI